jgi:hypothetical protein
MIIDFFISEKYNAILKKSNVQVQLVIVFITFYIGLILKISQ